MKTLIKSFALALSLGLASTAATFADGNPIGRRAAGASFQTGIYTTASGKLQVALNKQTGGAVDIWLRDAKGAVLYSQHLNKNQTACRTRLDLSQLADGTYELHITNGVETVRQTVSIVTRAERTIQTQLLASN